MGGGRVPGWLYLDQNKETLKISSAFFAGLVEIHIDVDCILDVCSAASQPVIFDLIKSHLSNSEIDRTVMIKYEIFDDRGTELVFKYVCFMEDTLQIKQGCIRAL